MFSRCKSIIVYCTRREQTARVAQLIRTQMKDFYDGDTTDDDSDDEEGDTTPPRGKKKKGPLKASYLSDVRNLLSVAAGVRLRMLRFFEFCSNRSHRLEYLFFEYLQMCFHALFYLPSRNFVQNVAFRPSLCPSQLLAPQIQRASG